MSRKPLRPQRIACVRVPGLAVQAVLRERFRPADRESVAVVLVSPPKDDDSDERQKVLAMSELAAECGVRLGGSLAAARGACPELVAVVDAPERTAEALASLADALGRFGPLVSLCPPDAVFVDTTDVVTRAPSKGGSGGSYGVEISVPAFVDTLESLGFQGRAAIATTPFAARALVSDEAIRRGDANPCPAPAHQSREVGRLGLRAVGLPTKAFHALDVVGIRTVGAFMALPGASLARRFGPEIRTLWRQAHGLETAPLTPYVPERPVVEHWQGDDAMHGLEPLCFCIKSLIDRALTRLEGRGLGIETLALQFTLDHAYEAPELDAEQLPLLAGGASAPQGHRARTHRTTLSLGHPKHDPALLLQLVRSRLGRRPPPGPVTSIVLDIERATSLQPAQLELFGDPEPVETIQTTVARLAAALGVDCFTPALREDYRPERAWEMTTMDRSPRSAAPPPGPRPTRLLRSPTPLERFGRAPRPPGALDGPERLVTGWWDSEPIARDYWVVTDRWGRRSWVYRDIATSTWFLHGHFD